MARIPEAEIERLKAETSVERLVEGSGIELRRGGKDLLAHCPFHEDAEASLVITPAKNLWHCFGCGAGGGPIDWVMRKNGLSFRHAVELLREGVSALAANGKGESVVKRTTVRTLAAPLALEADDQQLLNQVIGYYHETLKASPEALAYLKGRGLDHPELIERFRLGYANRTLGLRLPEKNRLAGGELRSRLQRIGIYRESGHEHFNGSLVVPVLDEAGDVTEVYGRKITANLRPGTPLHLYLPGPHRGVWNIEALAASKEIILTEALIDAMSFWCAGFRNVTAAYGVEGFTEDILGAFKRAGLERVLIAYDRDEAGDRAAERLAESFTANGIEPWRILFPRGMDVNDYACKVKPPERSLGLAIRNAQWLGRGMAPTREPDPTALPGLEVANCDLKWPNGAQSPKEDTASSLAAQEADAEPMSASRPPASSSLPAREGAVGARETEIAIAFGEGEKARRYRVRGLAKNLAPEVLKVNVMVACGERFHLDTLDLYAARARGAYVTQAAFELGVAEELIKADLGRVLLKLEALQGEAIAQALAPKPSEAVAMSEEERGSALALLRAPDLLDRIVDDLEACGLVGERTNKLVGYLAAVSRKLERPLAVLVQSSSAAGKSSLMDALLALMPKEERLKYSAMTGQSLFYMGASDLRHKILALVEEEGASRAAYALKLLQSEGELTIASTGKDPTTGNLVTQEYRVEGPVMILLTTTAITIDEELANRCLVLSVDEARSQTQAIHRLQRARRTLAGLAARHDKDELITLHHNAQRLLQPLAVVNPHAGELSFPDGATRLRRDHEKYLTLIDAIALLHQYQREVKTLTRGKRSIDYVEVTLADIETANTLAHQVLGRSLDELPPQTRALLYRIEEQVSAACREQAIARSAYRFSRRWLREEIGWGDTQLKVHLARLVDMEYLLVHRVGSAHHYELAYDGEGKAGEPFVAGLIRPEAHRHRYDAKRSDLADHQSVPGRGPVGPQSAPGRSAPPPEKAETAGFAEELPFAAAQTHNSRGNGQVLSYPALPLAAADPA